MGKIGEDGLSWIKLAQDRDPLWALVNVIINRLFPKKCGGFFDLLRTCTSQEGLCSIEEVT